MKKELDNQVSLETAYKNAAYLLEKGEFDLAEKQLSEILKKYPDDPNALRLSGISSLSHTCIASLTSSSHKHFPSSV